VAAAWVEESEPALVQAQVDTEDKPLYQQAVQDMALAEVLQVVRAETLAHMVGLVAVAEAVAPLC
jgi:hypothetical protein